MMLMLLVIGCCYVVLLRPDRLLALVRSEISHSQHHNLNSAIGPYGQAWPAEGWDAHRSELAIQTVKQ